MKNPKYVILTLLFAVSLASASLLVIYDFKPLPQICNVGEGCYAVKNSPYNALFFGVPNEYLAFVVFLALILVSISQAIRPSDKKSFALSAGIILMSLFAVYSIYLQAFIIHAYCKYCMTMDISIFLALILNFIFKK